MKSQLNEIDGVTCVCEFRDLEASPQLFLSHLLRPTIELKTNGYSLVLWRKLYHDSLAKVILLDHITVSVDV